MVHLKAQELQAPKYDPRALRNLPEPAIRLDLLAHAYDYEQALYTFFSRLRRLPEAGPAHSDAAPQGCQAVQA